MHWTAGFNELPREPGFWSATTAEDVRTVSRDWQTFSSERGTVGIASVGVPEEVERAVFLNMDPPKHDRIKALFQAGFTPRRIATYEEAIRAIVVRALEGVRERAVCDLLSEVAQPVVSRVIGSFMGIPPEDDAAWARLIGGMLGATDPEINPQGLVQGFASGLEDVFQRCQKLIAERRERPTDDLMSVLVHAEIDGQRLSDHEIVMGFFLLLSGGTDSTKATYCNGMKALIEHPEQRRLLLEDPSLIPGAVEESLRMFPPFTHFRRTATCDTELHGQPIKEGEKVVMWYVSSNRDEAWHPDPDRFDVRRKGEHQAFGGGGRHFCLGAALARLELRILFEETLKRYPAMELAGEARTVESVWVNQPKTLPVQLNP